MSVITCPIVLTKKLLSCLSIKAIPMFCTGALLMESINSLNA